MAAFNEIYHRGFQAASLSNILKDTGITKGALYHHFANKTELGYAVLDEVIGETMRKNWIEPLQHTDDPLNTIKEIIKRSSDLLTEESIRLGCPLNNIAQEMSPIDKGFRERIANLYQEWQDALANACEHGITLGKVDPSINPHESALLFISTLQGCMGVAKGTQNVNTLESCGKALIQRLDSMYPQHESTVSDHSISINKGQLK